MEDVPDVGGHRAYWRLPSEDVASFIATELNRWLLPLEYLIQTRPTASDEPGFLSDELRHSTSILALLRLLHRGVFESFPAGSSALWKRSYHVPGRADAGQEVPEYRRHGLGVEEALGAWGCVWLDHRLFDGHGLSFRPTVLAAIAFNRNRLEDRLSTRDRPIRRDRAIVEEEILLEKLHATRRAAADADPGVLSVLSVLRHPVFYLLAQLVCQSFVRHLLHQHRSAFPDSQCTAEEKNGDFGMDVALIESALDSDFTRIDFVLPRERKGSPYSRHFQQKWSHKIQALFDHRRLNPPFLVRAPFRQRVRGLMALVSSVLGPEIATQWLDALGRLSSPYLTALPAYDASKLLPTVRETDGRRFLCIQLANQWASPRCDTSIRDGRIHYVHSVTREEWSIECDEEGFAGGVDQNTTFYSADSAAFNVCPEAYAPRQLHELEQEIERRQSELTAQNVRERGQGLPRQDVDEDDLDAEQVLERQGDGDGGNSPGRG